MSETFFSCPCASLVREERLRETIARPRLFGMVGYCILAERPNGAVSAKLAQIYVQHPAGGDAGHLDLQQDVAVEPCAQAGSRSDVRACTGQRLYPPCDAVGPR